MSSEPVDLEMMNAAFRDFVPHNKALQLAVVDASWEGGWATLKLPFDARLIGDPETQMLHGGVITTLLDACAGTAVYLKLRSPEPIATLDLRVDYFARPPGGRDVLAKAECHRVTRSVAFVRAWAWVDDERDPFATATASFARATKGKAVTEEHVRTGKLP